MTDRKSQVIPVSTPTTYCKLYPRHAVVAVEKLVSHIKQTLADVPEHTDRHNHMQPLGNSYEQCPQNLTVNPYYLLRAAVKLFKGPLACDEGLCGGCEGQARRGGGGDEGHAK
ncbi:unnamed protein product, partial [Brenthis ino]